MLETFAKVAELAAAISHDVPDFDILHGSRTFIREGPFKVSFRVDARARACVCVCVCDVADGDGEQGTKFRLQAWSFVARVCVFVCAD